MKKLATALVMASLMVTACNYNNDLPVKEGQSSIEMDIIAGNGQYFLDEYKNVIPLAEQDASSDDITSLRARDKCEVNSTGPYRRSQTDSTDPIFGKANYQKGIVTLIPPGNIQLSPYTSIEGKSLKEVYPAVYYYMGGAGATANGVALDAGVVYKVGDGWAPYVQVQVAGSNRALPIRTTISGSTDTYAYRFDPQSGFTMETYVTPNGEYVVHYVGMGRKLRITQAGVITPETSSSKQDVSITYSKSDTPGWTNNPTPGKDSGQPNKFATSIAYNAIYENGVLLTGNARKEFLKKRSDSITDMTWDEQIIGIGTNFNNSTKKYSNIKIYRRPQWIKTDSDSDCKAPIPGGEVISTVSGNGEKVSISLSKLPPVVKPSISPPTPNPLKMVGLVGASITGNITFQSLSSSPVIFSVTKSSGLSMGGSASPLAAKATATITVSYDCKTANTFNEFVTLGTNDPNNSSVTIPVTVRCVGPAISNPAPNPLNLSGTVGSPVTGTFTFQNVGEVVNGAQAPLTFSLSPSAGLTATVPDNTSPLAGGGTATVTVSGMCTSEGVQPPGAVIVNSDDVARPVVNVIVNVTCLPNNPELSGEGPNPLTFTGSVRTRITQQLKFTNSGTADLYYTVTDGQIDYTDYTTHIFYIDKRFYNNTVPPKMQETMNVTTDCPNRRGTTNGTMTIKSNDPKRPEITVPMIRNCILGPAPMPIWQSGHGDPVNIAELQDWSEAACGFRSYAEVWDYTGLSFPTAYTYQVGALPAYQDLGYVRSMYVGYYVWFRDPADRFVYNPDPYFGAATSAWQSFAAACDANQAQFPVGKG